ncbi:MAG: nuclear transport factor 2 family protein [Steroidobacteraceae bacterium]
MTDRATVEQLLNALYAARMNGPVDQLASLFAPGVHFRIAGTSDGKPIAITADGIQAVRPWLAMLVKTFRVCDHQRLLTLVEGDHAAVHWSATIHSRITGAQVSTELVDLVRISDRQIVSYAEIFVPH